MTLSHLGKTLLFLDQWNNAIALPISHLFNISLQRGEYPEVLKFNNSIPIHKKGPKTDVINYRGISIIPVIGNFFEKIVNKTLRRHLKPLICIEQHVFMECRSTATNLTLYSDFVSKCLDDKQAFTLILMKPSMLFRLSFYCIKCITNLVLKASYWNGFDRT
jgi:hypothetical protein